MISFWYSSFEIIKHWLHVNLVIVRMYVLLGSIMLFESCERYIQVLTQLSWVIDLFVWILHTFFVPKFLDWGFRSAAATTVTFTKRSGSIFTQKLIPIYDAILSNALTIKTCFLIVYPYSHFRQFLPLLPFPQAEALSNSVKQKFEPRTDTRHLNLILLT